MSDNYWDSNQWIRMHFVSEEVDFREGSVLVIRSGHLATGAEERRAERTNMVSDEVLVARWVLTDSGAARVKIGSPGSFMIVLSGVDSVRRRDGLRFGLTRAHIKDHEITDHDLARGTIQIQMKVTGVYRITASDEVGRPALGVSVLLHNLNESMELKTNDAGEIILLGDPSDYSIRAADSTVRVTVHHL